MHMQCPHCQNPIEVVQEMPLDEITCPSCQSKFSLYDPEQTRSYGAEQLRDIGRFQILEHLGSGHFGDVWLAFDSTLDRKVAVKVPRKENLTKEDVEMFLREARSAAQLDHPNIVQVYEVGIHKETLFIISKYVAGPNLREWLPEHPPTPQRAAQLCATLADALHHAHDKGVVHRDMKPGNVLMDDQQQPYVTDFGLAKREGKEITITVEGRILGTPSYMSPEQAEGDAHNADRRSDVYSLGTMLFEMLTGRLPFLGKSKMLMIQQKRSEDPPRLRKLKKSVPRDLETICLKALEHTPDRRYPTARDMADDLRRFLEGKPITARPVGRLERGWRWAKRNPAVAALFTISAALLFVSSILVWRNYTEAQNSPDAVRRVSFTTNPSGARAVFVPLNAETGEPDAKRAYRPKPVTPLDLSLPPGSYLVVVVLDDESFHEVYRTVPRPGAVPERNRNESWSIVNGIVVLPPVDPIPRHKTVTTGMTPFAAGEFQMGIPGHPMVPQHSCTIPGFHLQTVEVPAGDFEKVMGSLPQSLLEEDPDPDRKSPIRFVRHARAMEYAERVGMRLPTESEYEFAATNGGLQDFPWGNQPGLIEDWPIDRPTADTFDRTSTEPPVFGLYSGVAEWTASRQVPYPGVVLPPLPPELQHMQRIQALNQRSHVVRGGPYSVVIGQHKPRDWLLGTRFRHAVDDDQEHPGLGFRCARSQSPRFLQPERD